MKVCRYYIKQIKGEYKLPFSQLPFWSAQVIIEGGTKTNVDDSFRPSQLISRNMDCSYFPRGYHPPHPPG